MRQNRKSRGANGFNGAAVVILVTASLYCLPVIIFSGPGIAWAFVAIYAVSLILAWMCWFIGRAIDRQDRS